MSYKVWWCNAGSYSIGSKRAATLAAAMELAEQLPEGAAWAGVSWNGKLMASGRVVGGSVSWE